MNTDPTQATQQVRELYEAFRALLKPGDEDFVTAGPAAIEEAIETPGFFDIDTLHAKF